MATGNASIDLKGTLSIKPVAANGCGVSNTSGPVFHLSLAPNNRAPAQQQSMQPITIDSAAAFEVLPLAANTKGTVVYLHALDLSPWLVRITFEATAAATFPLSGFGTYLAEFPPDDRVTMVELQGQGRIEWTVCGGIV